MEQLTKELERALEAGLYFLAVLLALDLPDICAALESPDGEANGARYGAWFDAWLGPKYPELTSRDVYKMRCGVLHQGRLGHPDMQYARVLFTLPNARRHVYHRNVIFDALNLDAVQFCLDVRDSVNSWFAAKKDDSDVQANLPRLLQYREHGLAPYLVGTPLIA